MRIIPAIDLKQGWVVRGVAGQREAYRPIVSRLCRDARPASVARGLVESFGFDEAYIADLDSITGGEPQCEAWQAIAATGMKLWLDIGIGENHHERVMMLHVTIVAGLESYNTVEAFDKLKHLPQMLQADRVIFSLDLFAGKPLANRELWGDDPLAIVDRVVKLQFTRLLVLDLAQVGVDQGLGTEPLLRTIRERYPNLELAAGGGVRGRADLQRLADIGCDVAIVASALHDCRLSRDDVHAFE